MYDFVLLSVRCSVRDSHRSRDYHDGAGIRGFYEYLGFYTYTGVSIEVPSATDKFGCNTPCESL
jgi:hypothetical protein